MCALGQVEPPVSSSSLEVEAPLLAGPKGSVMTLLNWVWTHHQFNASTALLTVNVSLGFNNPSKVESVEHGTVKAAPIAGKAGAVTVTVPLASADLLLF